MFLIHICLKNYVLGMKYTKSSTKTIPCVLTDIHLRIMYLIWLEKYYENH